MKIIFLVLFSSFLVQLGYFLWKLIADKLPRIGEAKPFIVIRACLTNWVWLSGMVLRLTGWAIFIKASSVGDLSLIQPLSSAGDFFLIFLAVVFLRERLTRLEWAGIFCVFLGVVGISFGSHAYTPAPIDLKRLILFISLAVMAVVVFVVQARRRHYPEIFLGCAVGICFGVSAILVKLSTSLLTLSGQALTPASFIFNPIFLLIETANISGLILIQMSFQNGRASIIFPAQLSTINALSVLSGFLLFSEKISVSRLASVVIIVIGSSLLQYSAHKKEHPVKTSGQ